MTDPDEEPTTLHDIEKDYPMAEPGGLREDAGKLAEWMRQRLGAIDAAPSMATYRALAQQGIDALAGLYVAGQDAALAASPADGIDVERLARAMHRAEMHEDIGAPWLDQDGCMFRAKRIAAEYARLERPETPAEPEVAVGASRPEIVAGRPGERDARAFWPVDHEEGE